MREGEGRRDRQTNRETDTEGEIERARSLTRPLLYGLGEIALQSSLCHITYQQRPWGNINHLIS